jgi:dihydrolipoamide dehydrogenase
MFLIPKGELNQMQYDIAILGGGPGGYVAAIYAGKKKAKVALIEKADIGGTCLNRGCIPTKALIHSANLYKNIEQANKFGLAVSGVDVNWDSVQYNKQTIVTKLTKGVESLLKANGVTTYRGYGELQDKNTIKIICDQTNETITSQNITDCEDIVYVCSHVFIYINAGFVCLYIYIAYSV